MTAALSITVDEIRAALARVLDEVERKHGFELIFDLDHYWELPIASAFDLDEPRPALTVGQLGDDIADVRQLIRGDENSVPWHDLAHLVSILRAVALADRP